MLLVASLREMYKMKNHQNYRFQEVIPLGAIGASIVDADDLRAIDLIEVMGVLANIQANILSAEDAQLIVENSCGFHLPIPKIKSILDSLAFEKPQEKAASSKNRFQAKLGISEIKTLGATICWSTPGDHGIEEATWSIRAVQEFVDSFFGVRITGVTAKNYLAKLGFHLGKAENRSRKSWTDSRRSWFDREYKLVSKEAKSNGQTIVFVKTRAIGEEGLIERDVLVTAAVSTSPKMHFAVLSGKNRAQQLSTFLTAVTGKRKTLLFVETGIEDDLKSEVLAYHRVEEVLAGRVASTKPTNLFSSLRRMLQRVRAIVKVSRVGLFTLGAPEEPLGIDDVEIEDLYKAVVKQAFMDCAFNPVGSDLHEDAIGWITSDSPHPMSFVSIAKCFGIDPDVLRADRFMALVQSTHVKLTSENRAEMHFWAKEYA